MNAPQKQAPAIKLFNGYTLINENDKHEPNLDKKYAIMNFLK